MSDDISMGALSGTIAERSQAALAAGCDVVLHCNGEIAEMRDVARAIRLCCAGAARRAIRTCAFATWPPERIRCRGRPPHLRRDACAGLAAGPTGRHRMSEAEFDTSLDEAERASDEPALIVDVEGFEGPLDLLLMLARQQKVDLAKISILALADQYLAFIDAARKLRLELAADYLVMAAWLAYLKSRLLLPDQDSAGGHAERRRHGAGAWPIASSGSKPSARSRRELMERPQFQRDVFRRGMPEPIAEMKQPEWTRDALRSALRLCDAAPAAARSRGCASSSARSGRSPKRAPRSSV